MPDAKTLDRYTRLRKEKAKLKGRADEIQAELNDLEAEIIRQLQAEGLDSVKRNGANIHLRRELTVRAKDGDTAALTDALRRGRFQDLLSPQHQRLKSFIRERLINPHTGEWEIDTRRLPKTIAEYVELGEFYRLGVRNS